MAATDINIVAKNLISQADGSAVAISSLTSGVQCIKVAFTTTTATSTATIPDGAVVSRCDLKMDTGLSGGTSPDIVVGYTGSTSAWMASADHAGAGGVATTGTYTKTQASSQASGSAKAVLVTISGTPTGGAGTAYVYYSSPAV